MKLKYYQLKKIIHLFAWILFGLSPLAAHAIQYAGYGTPIKHSQCWYAKPGLYDQYPWSVMYYYGWTFNDALVHILELQFHRYPEHIQSIELAHTLSTDNIVRQFFYPLVSVVQLAANVTKRNGSDENTIYEFDPFIDWRWINFPWNHIITTSIAIGEGISYATSIPSIEQRQNTNTKRLLNYLMLETTFSLPPYPQWQLLVQIHHRSGAYGLYHAGNTGSNDVGLGIRYLFN